MNLSVVKGMKIFKIFSPNSEQNLINATIIDNCHILHLNNYEK